MEVLVRCARRHLTPEDRDALRAYLRAGLDWEALVNLASRHKMLPLMWWHLQSEAADIPPGVAAGVQRAFLRNVRRMLQLSYELLGLISACAELGIVVVPYKGPALGAHVYGNVGLRQAGDLDLLVDRRDVTRTRALLLERGYRPRHELSRGGAEFMIRSRYSEEFAREDGLRVELHWAFTNGDIGLPLGLDVLSSRLRSIPLGGGVVPMFGREDLLLILCIHGCKHRWDRLEWLCGVAELLRASESELNWEVVMARAASLGVRRMLLLGLLLAHSLLDAPVPAAVVERARSDGAVARLAAQVPKLFTAEPADADAAGNLATDLFRFQLRERPRDRIRFIWYRITTPSRPESWSAVSVGWRWLPIHAFSRPFVVMSKLPGAIRQYLLTARD
jgi:hypothetical protein